MFELAKDLMGLLWQADLSAGERLERAKLLAKELAAAAALAEGGVDDLLRAFPGHFELVLALGWETGEGGGRQCR